MRLFPRFPPHSGAATIATRAVAALTAVTLLLAAGGCADSLRALGAAPAAATTHAEQLLDAFALRFSPNDFSPRYDTARVRLAEAALVPSRVFDDPAVWDSRANPSSRVLNLLGTAEGGRYRIETRPAVARPSRLGDTRHTISLDRLSKSEFRWYTRVDLAAGSASADEIALLASALFRAPEGRTAQQVREDYTAAFPRARAAFGRGFSIDSLQVSPGGLGTTSVTIAAGFHPELMRPGFPMLTGYLDRYLGPAKYHFALSDRAGRPLFDISGKDRLMTIHYRVANGKLVTLAGPPEPWSDTVQLRSDISLKVKLFTVGFHDMVSDFVISRTGPDRSLAVIARNEPEWDLPLFSERFIRAPLRRPFQGEGAMLRLSVQDMAASQTLLSREVRLTVKESTIMRFLGSLAARVLGDLDSRVEAEEDRFLHEGFIALRADLQALVPGWR